MDRIATEIWMCAEDLIEYANELAEKGRRESEEGLREIIGKIENLVDYMEDHPRK